MTVEATPQHVAANADCRKALVPRVCLPNTQVLLDIALLLSRQPAADFSSTVGGQVWRPLVLSGVSFSSSMDFGTFYCSADSPHTMSLFSDIRFPFSCWIRASA